MNMHNYLLYDFKNKRFFEIGRDWWYCGEYIIILECTSEFIATDKPYFQGFIDYLFHSESYEDVNFRDIIEKSYLVPFDKLKGKYKILSEKHKMPIYGYDCRSYFTETKIEYCIVTCSKKKFINIIAKLDLTHKAE